jgi:aspartate beta-hydroxylase/beta-hydroxylase
MISKLRKHAVRGMNRFIDKYVGGDKRSVFYDIKSTCPELLVFDENYDTIMKEFRYVDEHYQLQTYHDLDDGQYKISGKVEPDKKWKVFVLNLMGVTPELAQKLCPETCKLLKKIPNVYEAFFSILEPGKPIPAHRGPYLGYLRYHLGLKVPAQDPPSIRVKDQFYVWQDRQSVLFDDTWEHEVINQAREERIILIVDIFRPLPFWPHTVNSFFIKNIIRTVYANKVVKNVKAEKK